MLEDRYFIDFTVFPIQLRAFRKYSVKNNCHLLLDASYVFTKRKDFPVHKYLTQCRKHCYNSCKIALHKVCVLLIKSNDYPQDYFRVVRRGGEFIVVVLANKIVILKIACGTSRCARLIAIIPLEKITLMCFLYSTTNGSFSCRNDFIVIKQNYCE